jgi:hypothetical protein
MCKDDCEQASSLHFEHERIGDTTFPLQVCVDVDIASAGALWKNVGDGFGVSSGLVLCPGSGRGLRPRCQCRFESELGRRYLNPIRWRSNCVHWGLFTSSARWLSYASSLGPRWDSGSRSHWISEPRWRSQPLSQTWCRPQHAHSNVDQQCKTKQTLRLSSAKSSINACLPSFLPRLGSTPQEGSSTSISEERSTLECFDSARWREL